MALPIGIPTFFNVEGERERIDGMTANLSADIYITQKDSGTVQGFGGMESHRDRLWFQPGITAVEAVSDKDKGSDSHVG